MSTTNPNTNKPNADVKKPFTTTTTCTTVIKPLGEDELQKQQQIQGTPRRAPIEEASIPQPRPPATRDTANEPTLISQFSSKLSHAMHNVKEGAEDVADKIRDSVVGVAHKSEEALESTAKKVEGAVKRTGEKVEGVGEDARPRAEDLEKRTKSQADRLKHELLTDEQRIREMVERDMATIRKRMTKRDVDRESPRDVNEHHGTWESIKGWFRGGEHDDTLRSHLEFDEGAEMAKKEAFRRLDKLAHETERRIDEARKAADQWERVAREQVDDAWENARTHSLQIMRQLDVHHPPSSLAASLKEVKEENKRAQKMYMRDVCENHANRPQCYDTVKKLLGLAKENARIKVALGDKRIQHL